MIPDGIRIPEVKMIRYGSHIPESNMEFDLLESKAMEFIHHLNTKQTCKFKMKLPPIPPSEGEVEFSGVVVSVEALRRRFWIFSRRTVRISMMINREI